MSIVDDTNQNGNNGRQEHAEAPRPRAESARPNFGGQAEGLDNINYAALLNPAGDTASGDTLVRLSEAATKYFEGTVNNVYYDYSFLTFDRANSEGITVSILVILAFLKTSKGAAGSFHTLLIGDSFGAVETQINKGPETIIWKRHAGEAFDGKMIAFIQKELSVRYPHTSFVQADAEVVPAGFELSKPRTDALFTNAVTACATILAQAAGLVRVSIDDLTAGRALQVRALFNQPNTENAVGVPVRTDTRLVLSTIPNRQSNSMDVSLNDIGAQSKILAHVGGYMDVIYAPEEKPNNSFRTTERRDTRTYIPNFIITQLGHTRMTSLEGTLLSLAAINALRVDNGWTQCFRPNTNPAGGRDMHGVGGFNVEANVTNDPKGGYVMDTGKDLRDDDLADYLQAIMFDDLVVSIDIAECGPDTYFLAPFAMAAEGESSAQAAIFRAAEKLTKGNFAAKFEAKKNHTILSKNNLSLLNGDYVAPGGVRRDIRDVDYAFICNTFGANDAGQIGRWGDATQGGGTDVIARADEQRTIIEGALASEVRFTGMSRRYSFNRDFLNALTEALLAAKLDVSLESSGLFGARRDRTRGADYLDDARMSTRGNDSYFQRRTSGGNPAGFGRFRGNI